MHFCNILIIDGFDVVAQDYDNDGYHVMVKRDLPLKSHHHSEDITNRLNNHELVRNI